MNLEKKYGRVGVLMGGPSSEREISLKSGKAILNALVQEDVDAVGVDIITAEPSAVERVLRDAAISCAFIALHGAFGEDGQIQAILEKMKIAYIGSGVEASRTAIDKIQTQQLLQERGIRVAPYIVVGKNDAGEGKILSALGGYPVVVKPPCEGSSIGVTVVTRPQDLKSALEEAWKYAEEAFVEKFISGRELTVGILGDRPLPVIEIRSSRAFFDFTAKYQKGLTEYLVPAPLDASTADRVQQVALRAFQALGCRHFSRVDIILSEKGEEYVLEINTIPGFTETSLLPKAAGCLGITFNDLCLTLLDMVYGKKIEKIVHPIAGRH